MRHVEFVYEHRGEILELAMDVWREELYLHEMNMCSEGRIYVTNDEILVTRERIGSAVIRENACLVLCIPEENIMDWWMETEYGEMYTRTIDGDEQDMAIEQYIEEYEDEVLEALKVELILRIEDLKCEEEESLESGAGTTSVLSQDLIDNPPLFCSVCNMIVDSSHKCIGEEDGQE